MRRFSKSAGILLVAATIGLSSGIALGMGSSWGDSSDDKMKQAIKAVESKDYVGAINLLKDVLSGDAKNADALNYMGYSYRKIGNYERAMAFYKQALDVKPDHKGANEYIGEAYLEMKKPEMAKVYLDKLAKICGMDCDEYKELKKALDDYEAKNKQS